MNFPVSPNDVKIAQGAGGNGLQAVCVCGAVNWNHIEIQTAEWPCRNCGRVFTHYYPGRVERVLKLQKKRKRPRPAAPIMPALRILPLVT